MTKLQPIDEDKPPNPVLSAVIVIGVVLVLLLVGQLCGNAGAATIGGGW